MSTRDTDAPVVAEVLRDGFIESRHRGHVVGLAADGSVALSVGSPNRPMFPRSSAKPLQALAMLDAGWAPSDDEQIAIACASHSGEPAHVTVVRRVLATAGLDESALDNTPDYPLDVEAARDLVRSGAGPDPVHQNCSGKHAAMLATCVTRGWPVVGYREPDHPLQLRIRTTIESLAGEAVSAVAVDGCGAPLFALTLTGLAHAFANIATDRVADAMRAYPHLVGGTGRDVTNLMRAVSGLVAKDGAEGVYAASMPDGRVVALKVDDGAARARMPVLIDALRAVDIGSDRLDALGRVDVLGHGEPVGLVTSLTGELSGSQ
jgi:L-asparaginase II